ncbi:MAG: hypothetical protein LBG94_08015 [Treponema sp.]|jgi:NAD(P)-dependent dehydrogenase (short-subunit alcohol dehydrogenase family)|nr:hypothetical protein [Treponema sp.]
MAVLIKGEIDLNIALVTGLKKEFDKTLAAVFAREGYKVYAMGSDQIDGIILLPLDFKEAAAVLLKETGNIDIYIDLSDERSELDNFNVRSGLNDGVMRELYDANVTRPMAMLEAFFPLLEAGRTKRICYLTSQDASINETRGTDGYGYRMAKAGLHNFLQITRNVLAPRGYTIRAYDPCLCDVSASAAAEAAFNYFTRARGVERGDELRDDEKNLVFRDAYGRQHSW